MSSFLNGRQLTRRERACTITYVTNMTTFCQSEPGGNEQHIVSWHKFRDVFVCMGGGHSPACKVCPAKDTGESGVAGCRHRRVTSCHPHQDQCKLQAQVLASLTMNSVNSWINALKRQKECAKIVVREQMCGKSVRACAPNAPGISLSVGRVNPRMRPKVNAVVIVMPAAACPSSKMA